MLKINLSIDSEYHSQINNKFIPYEACNTTAAIMWLKTAGVDFWHPKIMQPEDYLTAILNGKHAWHLFKDQFPDMYDLGFRPQNLSKMLEWGINIMVGREVDKFITDGSLSLLIWELIRGRPVIMSGQFTQSGHFVCVVGCTSKQNREEIEMLEDVDPKAIEEIFVDDPVGDYHTKYRSSKGNNVRFKIKEFDLVTNLPNGKKWMHLMNPLMIEE